MQGVRRFPLVLLFSAIMAVTSLQVLAPREANAGFFEVWGQVHGGYLSGTSDRFEEGSQGLFGFAAGVSLLMIDVFMDVRLDDFDLDKAGMWNQIGVGASFSLPVPVVEPRFGARVAYLYAQYSEGARDRFAERLELGERSDEPQQKGINLSVQAGLDIELVSFVYLTLMADVGYHFLLPDIENAHGINFSALGGLKLKLGL